MTKEEYLAEVGAIHARWSARVIERPGGAPVDSPWRDVAEHAAEVLATAEDETDYWVEVIALTERFRAEHPLD